MHRLAQTCCMHWPGPERPSHLQEVAQQGTGLFLSGPGSCGPVPVARSRWPGRWPGDPVPVTRSPWPQLGGSGFGGPLARSHVCLPEWQWPGPVPVPVPVPAADSILSRPGGWVPVPVKRITYAVWPAQFLKAWMRNLFQEYGCSPNHW